MDCGAYGCQARRLLGGRRKADVHVVVVIRSVLHDSGGSVQPGRSADEDVLRAGGDEPVEEILGEPEVDLVVCGRRAQLVVASRKVDVDVEPILMREVVV